MNRVWAGLASLLILSFPAAARAESIARAADDGEAAACAGPGRACRLASTGLAFEKPLGHDWWVYSSPKELGAMPLFGQAPTDGVRVSGHPPPEALFPPDERAQLAIARFPSGGLTLREWYAKLGRELEQKNHGEWAKHWIKDPASFPRLIDGRPALQARACLFVVDGDDAYEIWTDNPGQIGGFQRIADDFVGSIRFAKEKKPRPEATPGAAPAPRAGVPD